jgi:hypothetical protein
MLLIIKLSDKNWVPLEANSYIHQALMDHLPIKDCLQLTKPSTCMNEIQQAITPTSPKNHFEKALYLITEYCFYGLPKLYKTLP